MLLLPWFVWLASANLIHAQTCTNIGGQMPVPLYTNRRLHKYQISHFLDFTLDRCLLECFLVARCKSLNHNADSGECELNGKTVEEVGIGRLYIADGFEYYELSAWDPFKAMAGTCATRPCAENQRCIQTTPFSCADVDCGAPPKLPYIVYGRQQGMMNATAEMTSLGNYAIYDCNDPWAQLSASHVPNIEFYDTTYKVCSSDNKWSGNTPICISLIGDCSDVKKCNPAHTDGHYWVFYFSERIKVYCHDMATSPKMYITLQPSDNDAYDAGDGQVGFTLTRYSKIRVVGSSFAVDVKDHMFATTHGSGESLDFASGASCHGDVMDKKSVSGSFNVNLTGTGFRMSWQNLEVFAVTPEYTDPNDFFTFTVNADYTELHGTCWGTCPSCGIGTVPLKPSHYLDDEVEANVSYASCV